jgi:hypothetical protein
LSVPLSEIGCTYAPGTVVTGNVCRERYAGQKNDQAELQAWSVAPDGFNDPRRFGQILLTSGDGYHMFFGGDNPPAPMLYRVLKSIPDWKATPEAITMTPMRDFARYAMNVPADADLGGIKGVVGFTCNPPVAMADQPYFEIRYRKPSREVFLQVVYSYLTADGKKSFNWFIFSPQGTAQLAPTTCYWKPGVGGESDRPAPDKITDVTLYAVIYGNKTPPDCQYDLYWLRLCKQTMSGEKPVMTPAAGLH